MLTKVFCRISYIVIIMCGMVYDNISASKEYSYLKSNLNNVSSAAFDFYVDFNAINSYNVIQSETASVFCSIVDSICGTSTNPSWKCTNVTTNYDICMWDYVSCNTTDKTIVKIYLSSNSLSGVLPSNIGQLRSLTSLRLGRNMLQGALPTSIGLLINLETLQINSNHLTGPIPTELGLLTKLQTLYLSHNAFSGVIPSSIGYLTNLRNLSMATNHLSGFFPSSLANVNSLLSVRLASNYISGSIPTTINLLSVLSNLDLSNNRISGSIPLSIGNLENIAVIRLSYNMLTGTVPSTLWTNNNLREVYLDSNQLDFIGIESVDTINTSSNLKVIYLNYNKLQSSIPASISKLLSLEFLSLRENKFSGTVPSSIGSLGKLTGLYLSYNSLSGVIPTSIGSLSQLKYLYMGVNMLTGTIPTELGLLSKLVELSIWFNKLTGFIPTIVGKFSQLEYIILRNNMLTGPIPSQFGCLSQLSILIVRTNSLTGAVPTGLGHLTALTYLELSENKLTGPIPTELGLLRKLSTFRIWNNMLTGPIPTQLGHLSLLQGLLCWNNRLTGPIPTSLGYLSNLADVRLSYNGLRGSLPTELGCLTKLTYLDLSVNVIEGSIPAELGYLSMLQQLHIAYNLLTGPIPQDLGKLIRLTYLDFSFNDLTATIPHELGYLSELVDFSLGRNLLTGLIPKELGFLSQLQYFGLWNNLLSGPIPTELGSLGQLLYMLFTSNVLSGCIPTELGYLSQIIYISLGQNILTGPIPTQITSLSQLLYLRLSGNVLTGSLPTELGYLSQILYLGLSASELTGTIATELGYLSQLYTLLLSTNMLTGIIPIELGGLSLLMQLDMSRNMLSGTIPPELGFLSQLNYLIMGRNKLTGTIPSELGFLSQLLMLDVSINKLTGSMPSSLGSLSSITSISLSENSLNGTIPIEFSSLTMIALVDLSFNSLTGSLPSELCILSSMIGMYLGNNLLQGSLPSGLSNIKNLRFFEIQNNRFTGSLPESLCAIHFAIFYMSNTYITSFPTCLIANLVDFLDTIPHELGSMDWGMCRLANIVQQSDALAQLVFGQTPVVVESEHPRIRSASSGEASIISFSTEHAFEYQIVFDVSSQTICPVRFCGDPSCSDIISEYTGEKGGFPGTGRIPKLIISRPSFYLSISSMSCANKNQEWGYRISAKAFTRGSGWSCTEMPPISYTRSLRGLSGQNLVYAANPCSWTGVVCDGVVNVTAISLKTFGIVGTIPSSLQYLTFLTSLDLSYNQFRGNLPSAIGYLRNLQSLDLTNNRLSGTLPSTLLYLTELSALMLSQNLFTGSIPDFIANMTYLSTLDMKSNLFIGKVSNSICPIIQSSKNTSIILWNNPKLTCYESCWGGRATLVFGGEISACSPTTVPTSQPTSPTFSPTTTRNSGGDGNSSVLSPEGVVGISIAVFVVVVVSIGTSLFLALKKRNPNERLLRLDRLPLHRAVYDQIELTEDFVKRHLHTAFLRDYDNKTVIDIILENGEDCLVSVDILYILVEDWFSVFVKSNNSEYLPQIDVWANLIEMDDDRSYEVVGLILDKFKPHIQLLAQGKDKHGRSYVDLASSRSKDLIRRKLFLHERYEMYPSFEHRSPSCQVWFAKIYVDSVDDSLLWDLRQDSKVALKFMKHRNEFLCEINSRRDGNLDNHYVVDINSSYDGDSDDTEDMAFRYDAISKGFEEYPYCIVMEGADQNLANMILNNNIAGRDMYQIAIIIKHVLSALQHMHERGIVHGDVKPMNVVVCGQTYKLIDLDAAASTTGGGYVGAKYSSLYSPPEMFWEDEEGYLGVRAFTRDSISQGPIGVYPYSLVEAADSHDMWSAGVLFYYLATGSTLFLADRRDNIYEQQDMRLVFDWDDEVKYQKISNFDQLGYTLRGYSMIEFARSMNFLSMLLYKDPVKRLSAKQAIDHPFLSGKSFGKISREEIEYDVFLSYRVDKDYEIADSLYESLVGIGLRVYRVPIMRAGSPDVLEHLKRSQFLVCLLSRGSINLPELDFYSMSAYTTESQNLVLEWLLALELRGRGLLHGIYPVMVGDNDGSDNYSDYFESGCHPSDTSQISEIAIKSLYNRFRRLLEDHSLGFPYRSQEISSITAILKDITMNHGYLFEGEVDDALGELIENVRLMVEISHRVSVSIKN